MRILVLSCLLFGTFSGTWAAGQGQWRLSAEDWYRSRSGHNVRILAAVEEGVRAWMRQPDYHLVVGYPGGEEGSLWARQLRDWLVGLGVPSDQIVLEPGLARRGGLVVRVARMDES